MNDNPGLIADWGTAASLGDGIHVAMCIGPDGTAWPWLFIEDGPDTGGCAQACCAPHEQLGRGLPLAMREKLGHRCGATTAKGTPCRNWVKAPGQRCASHPVEADRATP